MLGAFDDTRPERIPSIDWFTTWCGYREAKIRGQGEWLSSLLARAS